MQLPLASRTESAPIQTDTAKTVEQKRRLSNIRPQAAVQRDLIEKVNDSSRVQKQRALSKTIHNGPRLVAQRHVVNALFDGPTLETESDSTGLGAPAQEDTFGKAKSDPLQEAKVSDTQFQGKNVSRRKLTGFTTMSEPQHRYSGQAREGHDALPGTLKAGIEALAGLSMDAVNVHYNSAKPAQLQALAYAQGNDIHIGPGQERHLPHEVWHVVQQRQGRVRPTIQSKGVQINDDAGLESEADAMGARALQIGNAQQKQQYRQGRVDSLSTTLLSSATVQRRIDKGELDDENQDTLKALSESTQAGKKLVMDIDANGNTCTVKWADKAADMSAVPKNLTDAGDPAKGSDVTVTIPKSGNDPDPDHPHILTDGGADHKIPATVIALHELVHAYAFMRGMGKSMANSVVHSVLQGGILKRKELIPMEEIVTMGLADSERFTHEFHDRLTGADLRDSVLKNSKERDITENTLRNEKNTGVRLAYQDTPDIISPKDLAAFLENARSRIKKPIQEFKEEVTSIEPFVKRLTSKHEILSPKWQRRVEHAPDQIATWLAQIDAREAESIEKINASLKANGHTVWEAEVKLEVAHLTTRKNAFSAEIYNKWRKKNLENP